MKTLVYFILMAVSLNSFSKTLLECRPSEGSYEARQMIIGNIVMDVEKVLFFQQLPIFRTVTLNLKDGSRDSSRAGFWATYEAEIPFEEVITLQIENKGKVRRAYLQMESTPYGEDYFFEVLKMKCTEM